MGSPLHSCANCSGTTLETPAWGIKYPPVIWGSLQVGFPIHAPRTVCCVLPFLPQTLLIPTAQQADLKSYIHFSVLVLEFCPLEELQSSRQTY